MELDVSQAIRQPGESFAFDLCQPHEPIDIWGNRIAFCGDVRVRGSFRAVGQSLLVEADVSASLELTCERCLRAYSEPFSQALSAEFVQAELDEGDPDRYPFSGRLISLERAVSDLILLTLPIRRICGAQCRGICPLCGADRNEADCGCPAPDDERDFNPLHEAFTIEEE